MEWHYYNDQFDSRKTGEHGWRKILSDTPPNGRESTHAASDERCGKLCREGLWPFPDGIKERAMSGPEIGPYGYSRGEFGDSWREVIDGRNFLFARWIGPNGNVTSWHVVEMEWEMHNPFSHIPHSNPSLQWGWIAVQSHHEYV